MTDDEVVWEILARCRERAERGEAIDAEAILRAHPDLASRLAAPLDLLRTLDRAYATRRVGADPASPDGLGPGSLLGPYRLLAPIGAGGMGSVWRAVVEEASAGLAAGRIVAVKRLHRHLLATPGFLARFLREGRVGCTVVHENVVRTFAVGTERRGDQEHPYLVLEHVEGRTLRELLLEVGVFPDELVRHVGCEVARGLAALHAAGFLHRDVKPDNVLITQDHVVKLMDLGVARVAEDGLLVSQVGGFVGSVPYAAPERLQGDGRGIDARSDLHSLGLVLYEVATGANPYAADDVPQVLRKVLHETPRPLGERNPQASPFLEQVVERLLRKDPAERFPTAALVAEVLSAGEAHPWWKERAVEARGDAGRALRRVRIPRETEVHGREAELARLRAWYEAARGGEGRVVLIEGEAGIGKTRLVDEWIARLRRDGEDLNFLAGAHAPAPAGPALGAFVDAFGGHLGEAGSAAHLARCPLLAPAFDAFLRGEPSPPGAEPLTRESLSTCFVHVTRALAAERPTVLLVDDLHAASEEGLALFASLALAAPGHRILLVGTTRPGATRAALAGLERRDHVGHLPLGRLGPKELVRLLEEAFRSAALASSLGAQIALKSDGNPFFALEIVRGLREGQFVVRQDDGTWVTTQVVEDLAVPASVRDLVEERVAGLRPEERDVVEVASCAGFEFDPRLVGEVLGLAAVPVLRLLGRIERKHRIVRAAGRRFVFDHHQMQEAIYQGLSEPLREEFHRALAQALEGRLAAASGEPTGPPGALLVALCEHLVRGRQGAAALRHLDAAMAHLEGSHQAARAAALAERVLATEGLVAGAERARLLVRLASSLDVLARRPRQVAACREAQAIADGSGDEALLGQVARALAVALGRAGDLPQARAAFQVVLDVGRRRGDAALEAAACTGLGVLARLEGRLAEARGHAERSLDLVRASGDRAGEAVCRVNLGILLGREARHDDALAHLERGAALARASGHRRHEAAALGSLGNLAMALGRLAEARRHCAAHLALSREIGDRGAECVATGNLGAVCEREGRLEEAAAHADAAVALSREIGDREGQAVGLRNLGGLRCLLGDFAEGVAALRAARALSRDLGFRLGEVDSGTALGVHLGASGDAEGGREALLEAVRRADEVGLAPQAALARCALAAVGGGDAEEARAALEAHADRLLETQVCEGRHHLWVATGELGDLREALRRLEASDACVPEETRATMRAHCPLHRDVLAAARRHGLLPEGS